MTLCLPGQGRGWVQDLFPMHNTLVYSMCLAGDSVCQHGTVHRPHTSKHKRQSRGSL